MKKQTKSKSIIITFILFGIAVLIGLGVYFLIAHPLQNVIVTNSPGCQIINDPSNPKGIYTETVDSTTAGGISYKCTGNSECIVHGEMNVENAVSAGQNVIFRTNANFNNFISGTWLAIDTDGDGILNSYSFNQENNFGQLITPSDIKKILDTTSFQVYYAKSTNLVYIWKGLFTIPCTNPLLSTWIGGGTGSCRYIVGIYTTSNNAVILPTPQNPYASNNQEVYGKMTDYKWQCQVANCVNPTTFNSQYQCQNSANRCEQGSCALQNCKDVSSVSQITSSTSFSAKFNFCPQGVSFPFCDGTSNAFTATSAQVAPTDEYKLNGNTQQSVLFDPKYLNNAGVAKKSILVKKYDCSCLPLIQSNPIKYCTGDTNKVYCKPSLNTCPSGYIFTSSSVYCGTYNGGNDYSTRSNLCISNPGAYYKTCVSPINDYSQYQTCSGNETVSGSVCSIFASSNPVSRCSAGQQCIVDSTNKAGEGLGGCKCPNDQCTVGSFIKTGDSTYQKCTTGNSGCNTLIDDFCASGLIFDQATQKCVFNPLNSCNPLDKQCIGTSQIKTCSLTVINDKQCANGVCTGYTWNTANACPSNQVCKVVATNKDYCSCEGVSSCTAGQIKCTDTTHYDSCSKDPNDANSCLAFRTFGEIVPSDKYCFQGIVFNSISALPTKLGCRYQPADNNDCTKNNQLCVYDSANANDPGTCQNVGCGYPNSPNYAQYQCSRQEDTNGVPIQSCTNNACIATSDANSATQADSAKTRCSTTSPNTVQKVTAYTISGTSIYRWEKSKDCTGDYFCKALTSTSADCDICTKLTDSRGSIFELRQGANCVINQNDYTASAVQASQTKCIANTVYYVKDYADSIVGRHFYSWEIKQDADFSTNGVCKDGFKCAIDADNSAKCLSNNQFMTILSKDSFAVGEKIGNISVQLSSKVPNSGAGLRVTARLLDSTGKEISGTRITNLVANAQGKIIINLNYAHTKTENVVLDVIAGDPNGVNYPGQKTIVVAKTLQVKLSCPVQAVIGRPITCDWKVVDADTNQIIPSTDVLSVMQGSSEIKDYTSTTTSVTFTPQTLGAVEVKLSSSAPDYLLGSEISNIIVQGTTITQNLLVNSQDYVLLSQSGVSTGAQRFTFDVQESGVQLDLNSIDATMRTPSGAEDKLTFNKNPQGKWESSYSLAQAGQVYVLHGSIVPLDIKKATQSFEYKINTLGVTTSDIKQEKRNIWRVIIIALVIVIALIVTVILVSRKRRR